MDPEKTDLRTQWQQWNHSREATRRAMAESQKLRRQSKDLVQQWKQVVLEAKGLRAAVQYDRYLRSAKAATITASEKPFVATARRVPWRRLQIDDLDGPYEMWIAPGAEMR